MVDQPYRSVCLTWSCVVAQQDRLQALNDTNLIDSLGYVLSSSFDI